MKPVKQSELFDAIVAAIAPNEIPCPQEPVSSGGAASDTRPLRILLAEDSLVNQKLAVGLLERRGHCVHVANNGREALAALEAHPFDLVLMDVQMPEIDGLQATQALREREQATGRKRVPVIAMTAHAMTGDRERCLAAGMDSYISKPIRSRDLFETMARVVEGASDALPPADAAPPAAASDLDLAAMLQTVGGDRQLLREIADAFLEEAPRLLDEVGAAVAGGDSDALRRAAHTLKASLRYLGAAELAEQAFVLETCGREGRLPETDLVSQFIKRIETMLVDLPMLVGITG